MVRLFLAVGAASFFALVPAQAAKEFYIGEPVVQSGMQIVPNYLTGIEMDRMPPGMAMGKNAVHLEADVHATGTAKHGLHEADWIPYLTIKFTLTTPGTSFRETVQLYPMTAGDGPHYANNVAMSGPG